MDMKLSKFMEVYFEDKQNELKDRIMKYIRYMMEQHIIPYFGEQMLSEITASQIIQWQNKMQSKGFSECYLRMIQNQLTSLFTHASRIYDLHTNSYKKVNRMGNSDSGSLDFWTTEVYQRFIQTIESESGRAQNLLAGCIFDRLACQMCFCVSFGKATKPCSCRRNKK